MKKYVYGVKNGDILSLEKECIISFRTSLAGGELIFTYLTESKDYDTSYRLKVKETGTRLVGKKPYFIQPLRMYK